MSRGRAVLLGSLSLLVSAQAPFAIKSLVLSDSVSPQTIHFQVLDNNPFSGPGRGPPSCNRWVRSDLCELPVSSTWGWIWGWFEKCYTDMRITSIRVRRTAGAPSQQLLFPQILPSFLPETGRSIGKPFCLNKICQPVHDPRLTDKATEIMLLWRTTSSKSQPFAWWPYPLEDSY